MRDRVDVRSGMVDIRHSDTQTCAGNSGNPLLAILKCKQLSAAGLAIPGCELKHLDLTKVHA